MSVTKRVLLFFVLPILGTLMYEPALLGQAFTVIPVALLLLGGLGYLLWRRNSRALTFMIFLNGLNVIIRLMMLLSTSYSAAGKFNLPFAVFGLAGLAISFFLMLRLDKVDVRQYVNR